MSETDQPLQDYLSTYRQLLESIRQLALEGSVSADVIRTALADNPLELPSELAASAGADAITRELDHLFSIRPQTGLPKADLDSAMREVIASVFAANGEPSETTRDGTRHAGASPNTRYSSTTDHPTYRYTVSRSASAVPRTQRAKPPMPMSAGAERDAIPIEPAPPAEPHAAPEAAPPADGAGLELAGTPPAPAATPRILNAEIVDHDPALPLNVGDTYEIAFGVDEAKRSTAIGSAPVAEDVVFPPGVDSVELTVDLQGEDFVIATQKQTFVLKRAGKSATKARFEITPKREGRCTLTAIVHKDRNFVQSMTIEVSVGASNAQPAVTTSESRSPSAATRIRPRDVMLVLTPAIPSGYDVMARDALGIKTAHLEVEPAEMSAAITAARDRLLEVVKHTNADGDDVFQSLVAIPAVDQQAALRIMARAGALLFRMLFAHDGGSTDAKEVGTWLRELTSDDASPLSIQIMSKRAPIPWALMYVGDVSNDDKLDWNNFLGFRHIIEQLPIINTLGNSAAAITSDSPNLQVSINLNRSIDKQMRKPFVKDQEQFWSDAATAYPLLKVTSRINRQDFVSALANDATPDQILYFFGHAATNAIDASGGVGASTLSLTDDRITLDDLKLLAPSEVRLPGGPLVFINACESAELSPQFYGGFVTYFMSKGARGVIGTECETPAVFAVEWATRFFKRFFAGESLGALTLALRHEFLVKDGNPLGLLYAVHCDGDVQVNPSLHA